MTSLAPLSGLGPGLFVLRGLVLVIIILVVLYAVNPEIECWCNERWEIVQERYSNMSNAMKDVDFDVPLNKRRPKESIKDFYRSQESVLFGQLFSTRGKYLTQHHVGTVMKDGFHTDLPDNAMWRNGMVVIGPEIAELSKKKAQERPPGYNEPPSEESLKKAAESEAKVQAEVSS